ncbi:hypothetical protein D3H65_25645 [Paraflavitalea soli]|uniref:Uncharacterized protein n=1 Tax=Paraflavitalea soli TaxID=2315862 RepID=A0A3B7MVX5_9BACT|nr:outer membrane beta-barrel protein [Paraflavitalea soli]AXY77156.1 hypothetical protein D3H65_25645 [Paraflavitalea soli]
MKRQTLLLLAIIISSTATLTAQVQKGDVLLGATMGVYYGNSSGNNSGSSSNSNLSPRIGFGLGHNSVVGFRTNFGYQTSKSETSSNRLSATSIGGGLYWRHYMPIKKQIGWYIEANGGISFRKEVNKNDVGDKNKATATEYSVGAIPGIYYQPLPKLLLTVNFGGAGYSYTKNKYEGNPTSRYSNVYFNLMSSFTFGVDFILGKRNSG